jgi:hypothetical protein
VGSFCCPNGVRPQVNGFDFDTLSTNRSFFMDLRWYATQSYDRGASFAISVVLLRPRSSTDRIFERETRPALTFRFDVKYALGWRPDRLDITPTYTNCASDGCFFFSSCSLKRDLISSRRRSTRCSWYFPMLYRLIKSWATVRYFSTPPL